MSILYTKYTIGITGGSKNGGIGVRLYLLDSRAPGASGGAFAMPPLAWFF